MQLNCLLFGEARALMGGAPSVQINVPDSEQVGSGSVRAASVVSLVIEQHPKLNSMASLMVLAVNCEYVPLNGKNNDGSDVLVSSTDEVALIPPISGG